MAARQAVIVDLKEYRQRRQPQPARTAPVMPAAAMVWCPVWVMMPVWRAF